MLQRERAVLLVHDDEFAPLATAAGIEPRLLAWTDDPTTPTDATRTLDDLAARHADGPAPRSTARTTAASIILTSGTTGPPKGALVAATPARRRGRSRSSNDSPTAPRETDGHRGAVLPRVGIRQRDDEPAARRHDGARPPLRPGARARADRAPPRRGVRRGSGDAAAHARAARRSPGALRHVVAAVRPALRVGAARAISPRGSWMRSATSSTTSTARPRSGRCRSPRRPTCAPRPPPPGRPPRGTRDPAARRARPRGAAPATSGRIFVRGPARVLGLHRRSVEGRSSTGSCTRATPGTSTHDGRLFVDGRDDEMIVSGGENVFPSEVEDVIARHPGRRRGRGRRRTRPGVRGAAQGVRRRPARCRRRCRSGPRIRAREPRPLQGAAAKSSSSPSSPATAPAKSCAASSSSADAVPATPDKNALTAAASACTR